MLRVGQDPVSFSARAASGGDLGNRAAALLARIEWPGKPGASLPIAPLTPAEQARFEAGRQVYANLCVACHREDGRGGDRLAPSLLGSDLALGDAGLPIRILLHGKEGPVGLMPPLGQVFSDEQMAQVLTYVRRSWGNTGAPIEPAVVGQVRAGTTGRNRPWTNDELNAITPAAR